MKHAFRIASSKIGLAFFLVSVWTQISSAQGYHVRDDLGQINVDQAYMSNKVRSCVQDAVVSPDLSDCVGLFSEACMNEDVSWGQSTTGMFFCIEAEAAVWDNLIDEYMTALLSRYQVLDANDNELNSTLPLRTPSLSDAQQKWELAQDADCLVEYLRWRGGTGAKILGATCRLERSSERVIWLRTLLEEE